MVERFLLIDLGASLHYTHHKQSIYAFSSFLKDKNIDFNVWVPFGSNLNKSRLPIRKILLSGTHAPAFSLFDPRTWINSLMNKFLVFSVKNGFKCLMYMHVNLVGHYLKFLLAAKAKSYSGVLFTTACPYSVKTIYMLESSQIKTTIFFRLTNTSEARGELAELYDFKKLLDDAKNFEHVRIRFGVETDNYRSQLNTGRYSTLYLTKVPYIKSGANLESKNRPIVVSFLGYPTKDKGHEHILPLIKKVSEFRKEINWQVHLYEKDPLLPALERLEVNILTVCGKIQPYEMDKLLSATDLMCLPYNPKAFEFHSSAMHYHSMDYNIPVLSLNGTAFSSDIYKFKAGSISSNLNEMCEVLIDLSMDKITNWKFGCSKYNEFRNQTNEKFLDLNS